MTEETTGDPLPEFQESPAAPSASSAAESVTESAAAPAAAPVQDPPRKSRTVPIALATGVVALVIGIVIGIAVAGGFSSDGEGGLLSGGLAEDAAEEAEEETCTWKIYDSEDGEDEDSAEAILSDLVDKLPVPEWGELDEDGSNVTLAGYVWTDSTDSVDIDLYDVKKADYTDFVTACVEAGFDVDFDKDSTSYVASDADGLELDLWWYGKDLSLSLDAPEGYGTEEGIVTSDAELIEFLDEYDEFIDEYVDFMKDFKDADSSEQVDMLDDYSDLVSDYADFTEELEAYDTYSMTEDDYAYYLEITEDVADKLAEL